MLKGTFKVNKYLIKITYFMYFKIDFKIDN